MSIIGSAKHLFGGHQVSVKMTEVEKQTPGEAVFPITDTVMKFHVEITGKKTVTVTEHVFQVFLKNKKTEKEVLVAEENVDQDTEIIGAPYTLPYTLHPDKPVTDNCCMIEVDVEKALEKMNVSADQALGDNSPVSFFVRFTARIKGTLVDPDCESELRLIPSC